jgi:hypothetical protein
MLPRGDTATQVDDTTASHGPLPWRPPLTLRARSRFTHPAESDLLGTAGFGFWNDFFMGGRIPTLRAIWFFHASPPSDMRLDVGLPVGDGRRRWLMRCARSPLLLTSAAAAVPDEPPRRVRSESGRTTSGRCASERPSCRQRWRTGTPTTLEWREASARRGRWEVILECPFAAGPLAWSPVKTASISSPRHGDG